MKRFVDGYFLIKRHNLQGSSRSYVSHGTMRTNDDDNKEILIISGGAYSLFKRLKFVFACRLVPWLGMETSNTVKAMIMKYLITGKLDYV